MDPLAEKHPNISPFVYTANNPIKYIDPDGRDWYEYGGNIIWQEGSAKTYTSDNGDIYKNIGTSYTQRIDSRTVLNYGNNPSPESITVMAVDADVYVNQHDPNKIQCKSACDQMITNAGFDIIPRNGKENVVTLGEDGRAGNGNGNLESNLSALKSRIDNEAPVTLGIDYKDGHPGNHDKMTDHFVTAVGYTENFKTGQTSIRYFDPGPGGKNAKARGTAETNIISRSGNTLTGTINWGFINPYPSFTVTQIRSRK